MKIHIDDRQYGSFRIIDSIQLKDVSLLIDPVKEKLFHNDIFEYLNDCVKLVHSPTRTAKNMSGILVIDKNKTYGKVKNKFLYKCIPDDKRLPEFLIPYLPTMNSFSKQLTNMYIIFTVFTRYI